MYFRTFCNVPILFLSTHDLIELKLMMVILFEIFSIGLLHSTTKNGTKQLPQMKIQSTLKRKAKNFVVKLSQNKNI